VAGTNACGQDQYVGADRIWSCRNLHADQVGRGHGIRQLSIKDKRINRKLYIRHGYAIARIDETAQMQRLLRSYGLAENEHCDKDPWHLPQGI
jgi:hypothetical protein